MTTPSVPPATGASSAVRRLTGAQKSAVLCLALGPKGAAAILKQLAPEEVESVSREIAALRAVGPDVISAVLAEFQQASRSNVGTATGGIGYARAVLEEALGPGRARSVLERVQPPVQEQRFKRLRKANPETLAALLRAEHPQTVAAILAHLDPDLSARVVKQLDPDVAADALYRMARLDRVSPDVLALAENALSGEVDVSLAAPANPAGGAAAVAKVLNRTGKEFGQKVLDTITRTSNEVAEKIQALLFVFEDLLQVDGKGIQRILRDVDTKDLALALKGASEELKRHIRANMSERAGEALEEQMEMLGPVRVRDVEAAHAGIIAAVRRLEADGEIVVKGRGGDDDAVIA